MIKLQSEMKLYRRYNYIKRFEINSLSTQILGGLDLNIRIEDLHGDIDLVIPRHYGLAAIECRSQGEYYTNQ